MTSPLHGRTSREDALGSYDSHQRDAELRQCSVCKREFFCTHAEGLPLPWICQGCQGKR